MLSIRSLGGAAVLLALLAPAATASAAETDTLTILSPDATIAFGTPWEISAVATGPSTISGWGATQADGANPLGSYITVGERGPSGVPLVFTPDYPFPVGTWDVFVTANATDADGAPITIRSDNTIEITVVPVKVTPEIVVEKSGLGVTVRAGLPGLIQNVRDSGTFLISFSMDGHVVDTISRYGHSSGWVSVDWYPLEPATDFEITVVWQPLDPGVIATPATASFVSGGEPRPTRSATPTRTASPTASPTPTPTRSSTAAPNPSGTTSASPVTAAQSPLPLVLGLVAALVGIAAAVVGVLFVRRRAALAQGTPETENADQPGSWSASS